MGGRGALLLVGGLVFLAGYTFAFWGYAQIELSPVPMLDLLLPTRLESALSWWNYTTALKGQHPVTGGPGGPNPTDISPGPTPGTYVTPGGQPYTPANPNQPGGGLINPGLFRGATG